MSNEIYEFEYEKDETFRDSIGTITEDGKRNFIYPKKPSGFFYEKRKLLSTTTSIEKVKRNF